MAVRWQCGGGAGAVRWRCGGGAVAVRWRCGARGGGAVAVRRQCGGGGAVAVPLGSSNDSAGEVGGLFREGGARYGRNAGVCEGTLAVRWRCGGGAVAVRWRCGAPGGGAAAVRWRGGVVTVPLGGVGARCGRCGAIGVR